MIDILDFLDRHAVELPRIRIVDVGAMALEADPWDVLVRRGAAEVLGFEPQTDQCARLEASAGPGRRYLPVALGDGGRWPFHRCSAPMTSSVYRPDLKLASRFQRLAELMQVVEVGEIGTTRLDDVPEARETDLLKLDAQGFELTILHHAGSALERALVVQTEASFVPLYHGQPLFADVDAFLRGRGLMLHMLAGIGSRAYKPLVVRSNLNLGLNQALWTDAVYVPELERLEALPPPALLKLAVLLHAVYGSVDLAAVALAAHDRVTGTRLHAAYLRALTRPAAAA